MKLDAVAEKNGVEKIKTIGDCYMAAAGLPLANPTHALTMARFGLQVIQAIGEGDIKNPVTDEPLQVRAGMHSGSCVAGVIGSRKFAYDVWGDTVNTASRMESYGVPLRIHCSKDTQELIKDYFICEQRPPMEIKGKGVMQTYFVNGEREVAQRQSFCESRRGTASRSFSRSPTREAARTGSLS